MSQSKTQSYENHRKFVPAFHIWLFLMLLVVLGWNGYRLVTAPSMDTVVGVVLAIALVMTAFFARFFALKVQDRVIRLEMRLRMLELLPDELQRRVHEFTPSQLVAMRFASDEELPSLAAAVLKDNITNQDAIKKLIQTWNADHLRA